MNLSALEIRVIGVLLEKELTTPDQYPLSLNALLNGCNQKSNRCPIMALDAVAIQDSIDSLSKKGLLTEVIFGSRTAKYKHRFCNTEFSQLHLSSKELACLCVMFVRGPQTPGELKTRTARLCEFSDFSQVEDVLERMMTREGEPWVKRLPKEPGKRDFRYAHLLGDDRDNDGNAEIKDFTSEAVQSPVLNSNVMMDPLPEISKDRQRIDDLEQLVAEMRAEIDQLKQQWHELNN